MEVAAFRKTKRAGYQGDVSAYVVAEDEFGTWSFAPTGTVVRWTDGGDQQFMPLPHEPGFLRLIPRDTWWIASWWPDGNVFIDTVTPVRYVEDAWTWVDLELDVRRGPDGEVVIEDEDEFDAAIAGGHISAEEEREARAAASQLVAWLMELTPPFDDTGWRRFHETAALGLPPLP